MRIPVRRSPHGWARVAMACALACAVSPPAQTQAPPPTEYQVKAAYLANFGRFVVWPQQSAADDPFSVCVLGDDPFGSALDSAVAGEMINRAPLVARRITKLQEAASCRILFIARSEDSRLKAILAGLRSAGVLTVSDIPEFARRGGMIELVLVDSKVRFEINVAAAGRSGLTFSSELLKLATAVRRAP